MERVFGFSSGNPSLSLHGLYPFRNALGARDEEMFTWGLGYHLPPDGLELKRRPQHMQEVSFFHELEGRAVCSAMGHVRSADGEVMPVDVQPFRFKHWLFAMLGGSGRHMAIRDWLLGALPPFLKRNIRGSTEAELVFGLFLSFLKESRAMYSVDTPPEVYAAALASTYDTWRLYAADAGGDVPRAVLLASDGRRLVALSSIEDAAGYRVVSGVTDCPYCRDHASYGAEPKDHPDLRVTLVLADSVTAPRDWGLTPLPPDRVLVAQRGEVHLFAR